MAKTGRKKDGTAPELHDAAGGTLADAFRRWGYLQADIDWLGRLEPYEHADIADAKRGVPAHEVEKWRGIYSGTLGVEFMHIVDRERCRWIAGWMEGEHDAPDKEKITRLLARSELFERYLHTRYVGSKRYSIEGIAGLIPLLESILDRFIDRGGELAMLAMSHRGRLNVMTNIAEVPAADMFAAMEDIDPRSVLGSGDVKYHLGATGMHTTPAGRKIKVHLSSNPSHLEAVDPVITGRVRAKQDRMGADGAAKILCVTLHGDAAFAGQGVVAETLNLASLGGYSVGGSVRIVVNNLIGFTADLQRLHSSRYSSDVAKRLQAPIVHVNAEDPEAIHRVGEFAVDYRMRFGDDVVVDLVGYRRYGHSEVEDPSITQPLLYRKIEKRPMLWELYAERIGLAKVAVETIRKTIWDELERQHEEGRSKLHRPILHRLPPYWDRFRGGPYLRALEVETGVARDELRKVAERMTSAPEDFNVHPKIRKLFEQRRKMAAGEIPVDWGMAEALAVGSLLWEGVPVRIAGQDSRRGTFNQRHAVIIDTERGGDYFPLAHLHPDQGRFTVLDSPLCETAALGFEYGYSREYPDALGVLGGPVRRFRQRRPADHRPVHLRGRGQVETALGSRSPAPSRFRRPGPRALQRQDRTFSPAGRGRQHPGLSAADVGAVLPPSETPGAPDLAEAPRRVHAKGHAARRGGVFPDRRIRSGRELQAGAPRSRRCRTRSEFYSARERWSTS